MPMDDIWSQYATIYATRADDDGKEVLLVAASFRSLYESHTKKFLIWDSDVLSPQIVVSEIIHPRIHIHSSQVFMELPESEHGQHILGP